jgi:hypothetical protein
VAWRDETRIAGPTKALFAQPRTFCARLLKIAAARFYIPAD